VPPDLARHVDELDVLEEVEAEVVLNTLTMLALDPAVEAVLVAVLDTISTCGSDSGLRRRVFVLFRMLARPLREGALGGCSFVFQEKMTPSSFELSGSHFGSGKAFSGLRRIIRQMFFSRSG
jgi:hypothetical protein